MADDGATAAAVAEEAGGGRTNGLLQPQQPDPNAAAAATEAGLKEVAGAQEAAQLDGDQPEQQKGEEQGEEELAEALTPPGAAAPLPSSSAEQQAGGGGKEGAGPVIIHKREDGRFACPFCQQTYQLAKSTRYHIQRRHPGKKCHVLQKPGRAVGLVGQAKIEHVRRLNREANRRYQDKMRAIRGQPPRPPRLTDPSAVELPPLTFTPAGAATEEGEETAPEQPPPLPLPSMPVESEMGEEGQQEEEEGGGVKGVVALAVAFPEEEQQDEEQEETEVGAEEVPSPRLTRAARAARAAAAAEKSKKGEEDEEEEEGGGDGGRGGQLVGTGRREKRERGEEGGVGSARGKKRGWGAEGKDVGAAAEKKEEEEERGEVLGLTERAQPPPSPPPLEEEEQTPMLLPAAMEDKPRDAVVLIPKDSAAAAMVPCCYPTYPFGQASEVRKRFQDLVGLSLQEAPEGSVARELCLEAFVLLWSRDEAVYRLVEAEVASRCAVLGGEAEEGQGAPVPLERLPPAARLESVEGFLRALCASTAHFRPLPACLLVEPAAAVGTVGEEEEKEEWQEGEQMNGHPLPVALPAPHPQEEEPAPQEAIEV